MAGEGVGGAVLREGDPPDSLAPTSGPGGVLRVWEREALLFRRVWRTALLGSFLQPLLYLAGMGLGVGSLVDEGSGSAELLGDVSYLAFLAPALVAAAAMNVCAQESLWPRIDGFLWSNAYRAATSTPVTPAQVAGGVGLWYATRALITVVGVVVVLTLFDDTRTWGLLGAIPAGVLTGLAFALPITAWTSTRTGDVSFPAIMRFGIIPMFLFGGVFYPIDQLPTAVAAIARITPLWHGVELARGSVLGTLDLGATAVHVAVLLLYLLVGALACRITFTRRLTS
jgi:lipooligosaccharide transport system permease protein